MPSITGGFRAALPILTVSQHFHVQVGGGGTGAPGPGCSCALASRAPLLASRPGRRTAQPASVCAGCLAPTLGVLGESREGARLHAPQHQPHPSGRRTQPPWRPYLRKDFRPRTAGGETPLRGHRRKSLFNSKHAEGGSAGEYRLAFFFSSVRRLSQFPVTVSEKAQVV